MTRASDFNWDRLRRDAERDYERRGEGRRRRAAGQAATAAAEELAWWVRHRPEDQPIPMALLDPEAALAAALAADQAVYVYCRGILVAKLPPSSMYNPVPVPEDMALETLLWSEARQEFVPGPAWGPGEWTFCGRGHEGE